MIAFVPAVRERGVGAFHREFEQYCGPNGAVLRGVVEQYSSWKTWLTDSRYGGFTADSLARNAQIDFSAKTGLPGGGGTHDAGYSKARTLNPLECIGGDSTVSCDTGFAKWAATTKNSAEAVAAGGAPT